MANSTMVLFRRVGLPRYAHRFQVLAGFLLLCLLPMQGVSASAGVEAQNYPVLSKPAQHIELQRAVHAPMLAITRAGERLVAVGEWGLVLLSDDNGHSWRQAQSVPVSVPLTAVQFVSPLEGWAVGHLGVVLHTKDGGEHWGRQLDGLQAARLELAAAEAAAESSPADAANKKRLMEAKRLVAEGPDRPFLCLYFRNAKDGFVFGAFNLAFRTEDGGLHWIPWMAHIDNPMELHLYGVAALGEGLLVVGEQGALLRSDGGDMNFTLMPSPDEGSWFGVLKMTGQSVLLYGLVGAVYRSGDDGSSWQESDSGTHTSIGTGISLKNGDIALTTVSGQVVLSQDGGQRFHPVATLDVPVTGIVQAPDGSLVVSSLSGPRALTIDAPRGGRRGH